MRYEVKMSRLSKPASSSKVCTKVPIRGPGCSKGGSFFALCVDQPSSYVLIEMVAVIGIYGSSGRVWYVTNPS